MIEATASKSFAERRANRAWSEVTTIPPTWLNLVCLDAPLVALGWQWLFARSFGIPIAPWTTLALFLTAWLIYLADRFGDSLSVADCDQTSLRQRFCLRHRAAWVTALAVISVADLILICTTLEPRTFLLGAGIGALAVGYLTVNQVMPSVWGTLPLKEVSIGFLFTAGTMISLERGLTSVAPPAWLLFACLCSLNCISIAVWERELDLAQGRISIATSFPKIAPYLLPAHGSLVLTSLAFMPSLSGIYLCVTASAIMLAAVHFFRSQIDPDTRTALADIVLLTPVVLLIGAHGS